MTLNYSEQIIYTEQRQHKLLLKCGLRTTNYMVHYKDICLLRPEATQNKCFGCKLYLQWTKYFLLVMTISSNRVE